MPFSNKHIARVFLQIAARLEVAGESPFRFEAYRKGAEAVMALPEEAHAILARGESLPRRPGLGKVLVEKIATVAGTGTVDLAERLKADVDDRQMELLRVRGLTPRRIRALKDALGIVDLAGLEKAVGDGSLVDAPGFGPVVADRVARSLYEYLAHRGRVLRVEALDLALQASGLLAQVPGCTRVEIAGSVRRGCESVGHIDLVVVIDDRGTVAARLLEWDAVERLLDAGNDPVRLLLADGPELRVYSSLPALFGATLHRLTGSAGHVAAVEAQMHALGWRLEPTALIGPHGPLDVPGESDFYQAIGLPWVPPELREDRGEIEAARGPGLPRLVDLHDLRGDLHCHTTHSDGDLSPLEMARAAADLGYQYLGVSDHTHNVAIANGMSPDRALLYADEVLSLRGRVPGLTLLAGVEVDILKDGSLDLPDAVLERFDYVIASVHSHFSMPEEEMTARVLRAMEHRLVSILAHPTGRLIGSRSSIPLDIDRVLRAAARTGTLLELNSNPERLDLDDVNCRKARTLGIPVAISSDAHERRGLDNLQHGVVQARRGWLEPRHVANTLPVEDLLRLLRRKR